MVKCEKIERETATGVKTSGSYLFYISECKELVSKKIHVFSLYKYFANYKQTKLVFILKRVKGGSELTRMQSEAGSER